MEKIQIFIQLTRLNKPIGFMLLFWPCLWGLCLAFNINNIDKYLYIKYVFFFLVGSILMRSAGCIINDIVDINFDKMVNRTKSRPLASGRISKTSAFIYAVFLCIFAFFILIQFNKLTIVLGITSMFLAFSYPFIKRFTYWPQLYLGLTFNWGIIMAWTSLNNNIGLEPILLYLGAIFWTLGYDTIYGLQDIEDDEIIGVKSTSIKFKNSIKSFVGACYFMYILFFLILAMVINANIIFFIFIFLITFHLFYQIKNLDQNDPVKCLKIFKSNNFAGLLVFITISTLKFF